MVLGVQSCFGAPQGGGGLLWSLLRVFVVSWGVFGGAGRLLTVAFDIIIFENLMILYISFYYILEARKLEHH